MTDIMTLGGNSLRGYGRAIATVSDNIGQAQTPGYARRRADFASGQIVRYADDWREAEARTSNSLAAQATARLTWLQTAEAALNDDQAGVGQRIGAVFDSGSELAADVNSAPRRVAFLQAVGDAASAFRASAAGLESALGGITGTAGQSIDGVNARLSALRDINQKLLATPLGSPVSATLFDQRDMLLAQVGESLGVDVSLDGRGLATVRLAGSGDILADASRVGSIALLAGAGGVFTLSITDVTGAATSAVPQSGAVAGLMSAASDIAARRRDLDALAEDFADLVNSFQARGRRDDGLPGSPLLNLGADAALSIAVLDAGPSALALADASHRNGNLLALSDARREAGVEASWAQLVSLHAQKVASAELSAETTRGRSSAAKAARDEMSGVDLDQEAADLLRFQQSYDAAARVIQAAREMLQSILNAVR